MKIIFLVWAFLVTGIAYSFPVPQELKDGTITVTTKDGKTYTFSENNWKVVSRTVKVKKSVTKPVPNVVVTTRVKTPENSIFAIVGAGKTKIESSEVVNGEVTIDHEYEPVYGIRYVRSKDVYSMSIDYLSNKTATVGLGYSFSDF